MRRILPRSLDWVRFLLPWSIPPALILGIVAGSAWTWLGWAIVFIVHPGLDWLIGAQEEVAPMLFQETGARESLPIHSALLYLQLPLQLAIFAWAIPRIVGGFSAGSFGWIGTVISLGCLSGAMGITVAHELIHRPKSWERGIGIALLAMVNYAHFRIEHVFGHHARVATPDDPATSRRGETLYGFWPRTLAGGLLSAIRLEARRLKSRPLARQIASNRILHYLMIQGAACAAVYTLWGPGGLAVHFGQSLFAILLLETVNYVEHYGLERREVAPGRHESVTSMHSWDSRHVMTNAFLYNLGRHSHHHAQPLVPYERLRLAPRDQALPFGYSTLLWLALFPPLWFRVFEPRLSSRR